MKTDFLQPVLVEKKQFLCLSKWCDHVLKYNMPNTWMNILKTKSWVIWEVDKCTVTATAKNRYNDKNQFALDNLLRASRKRKKRDKKESVCKIWLFLKRLPSNRPTNAPTRALFHILMAIPHSVSTQAGSHSEIHPGDLSCPALMLRHLMAPTTHPAQAVADCSTSWLWHSKAHLFPPSYVATTCSPQLLSLGTKEENSLMCQFPSLSASAVAPVLPTSAHSAPLDLTFPICHLSLLIKKSKLGQVLTSFCVGHRK